MCIFVFPPKAKQASMDRIRLAWATWELGYVRLGYGQPTVKLKGVSGQGPLRVKPEESSF